MNGDADSSVGNEDSVFLKSAAERVKGAYARRASSICFRRRLQLPARQPYVSFTFDDFPESALLTGGALLHRAGSAGTFYVSLGLMGKQSPSGRIFTPSQLDTLLEQGHELGCHTYSHLDAWKTPPTIFEKSVIENQEALTALRPGLRFRSHSYPLAPPRPFTKSRVARHMECSRGGGQATNSGLVDLNNLRSFFLEKNRDGFEGIQHIVDENRIANGWLIFSTHDVSNNPSPFGCTPELFEATIRSVIDSGARILPVIQVLEELGGA